MDVHALVLEVDPVDEDTALGVLGPQSLGAEVGDGPPGRRIVRLSYPSPSAAAAQGRRYAALGFERRAACPRIERVRDERWVERYQETLRPFAIGRRFWIDPTGVAREPAPTGRIAIRLTPGRAFGTGEHATTRLCVRALEDRVRAGARWLDLGCGTGILALVAWHCGARSVRAVDHDPEAVSVAREVLRANGLADRIEVAETGAASGVGERWDGVVANLDEATLVAAARPIARLLVPGGLLVGSGFLEPDATRVADAIGVVGFERSESRVDDGWAAVVWNRR